MFLRPHFQLWLWRHGHSLSMMREKVQFLDSYYGGYHYKQIAFSYMFSRKTGFFRKYNKIIAKQRLCLLYLQPFVFT